MSYTTFNKNANNALSEPMFMGNSVNVSRYDQQRFIAFEKLVSLEVTFRNQHQLETFTCFQKRKISRSKIT